MARWLICLLAPLIVMAEELCLDIKEEVTDLPEGRMIVFTADNEAELDISKAGSANMIFLKVGDSTTCKSLKETFSKSFGDAVKGYSIRLFKLTDGHSFGFVSRMKVESIKKHDLEGKIALDGDADEPAKVTSSVLQIDFNLGPGDTEERELKERVISVVYTHFNGDPTTVKREAVLIKNHIKEVVRNDIYRTVVIVTLRDADIQLTGDDSASADTRKTVRATLSAVKKPITLKPVTYSDLPVGVFRGSLSKVVSATSLGSPTDAFSGTVIAATFECNGPTQEAKAVKAYAVSSIQVAREGTPDKTVRVFYGKRRCSEMNGLISAGQKAYGFGTTVLVTHLKPVSLGVEVVDTSTWALNLVVPANMAHPGAQLTIVMGRKSLSSNIFLNGETYSHGVKSRVVSNIDSTSADAIVVLFDEPLTGTQDGFKLIGGALVLPQHFTTAKEDVIEIQWEPSCAGGRPESSSTAEKTLKYDEKYNIGSYNLEDFGLFYDRAKRKENNWKSEDLEGFSARARSISNVLKGIDIIMLQEVHSCMDLEYLVKLLGPNYKGYMVPVKRHPRNERLSQHNVAIVSQVALVVNAESCTTVNLQRCVKVTAKIGNKEVEFVSVHFKSDGKSPEGTFLTDRKNQANELKSEFKGSAIVFGDFNDKSQDFANYMKSLGFEELMEEGVDKGYALMKNKLGVKVINKSSEEDKSRSDHPRILAKVRFSKK